MAKDIKPDVDQLAAAYEVGYGKPPAHTQFKKGQSGNPRGRPKGSLNIATTLKRELASRVTVTENGRQKTLTKGEATIKQLVNRSAQGDIAYMRLLLPAMQAADAALAADERKAAVDLTDPALLSSLVAKFNHGNHVVLKASSSVNDTGEEATGESPGVPGTDEGGGHD